MTVEKLVGNFGVLIDFNQSLNFIEINLKLIFSWAELV
jgi:hypothetical protein